MTTITTQLDHLEIAEVCMHIACSCDDMQDAFDWCDNATKVRAEFNPDSEYQATNILDAVVKTILVLPDLLEETADSLLADGEVESSLWWRHEAEKVRVIVDHYM